MEVYRRRACNFKEAVAETLCSQSAHVSAQTRSQLYQERKCMCVGKKERRIISGCCRAEVVIAWSFSRLLAAVCPLYRTPGGDQLDPSLISNTRSSFHIAPRQTLSPLFYTVDRHFPPLPSSSFVFDKPNHYFSSVRLHQLHSPPSPFFKSTSASFISIHSAALSSS